jgi:Xaa-Pro dipeptidase
MTEDPAWFGNDYALVPKAEIQSRIERFQKWLEAEALDGAFLLQHVDIFYFSGTLQRSILFVPASGQPLLMVIKSVQRAINESSLKEVLPLGGRDALPSLLADFNHAPIERVGLELDVLPTAQYLWFKNKFPQMQIVDVSPGIRTLRMIKSPYEIDQIRRSAAILDKGYRQIRGLIREGMPALEIDGLLFSIARREGHMGVMRMRGWNQEMMNAHVFTGAGGAVVSCCETPGNGTGITPAMPQGAGRERVTRNQPIYIDYGVAVNGYHGDQTRTLVIGELDRTLARAHACSEEILETLGNEIRPGMTCRAIYDKAKAIAGKRGFEDHFMGHGEGQVRFLGHGLGLEIDEMPVIAPKFKMPVEEGMVFALEPKFSFPGLGIVGIEDDYLVTAQGLERLTLTEQNLLQISGGPAPV